MTSPSRSIGVRKLKATLSEQLRSVRRGETIVVTDRGTPVARIVPEGMSEAVVKAIQDGKLSWSGGKPSVPRHPIRLRGKGKTAAEMIIEDRG